MQGSPLLLERFALWKHHTNVHVSLGELSPKQRQAFLTAPPNLGGLGLSPDDYFHAVRFTHLYEQKAPFTDKNFFFRQSDRLYRRNVHPRRLTRRLSTPDHGDWLLAHDGRCCSRKLFVRLALSNI